jgi:hypothetical protein
VATHHRVSRLNHMSYKLTAVTSSSIYPPCSTPSTTMRVGIPRLRYVVLLSFCRSPWKYHHLQSPLSLAPSSDFRFPSPVGDYALDISSPIDRGNSIQERDPLPRYSSMFRMGLFFTVRGRSLGLALFKFFCDTASGATCRSRGAKRRGQASQG